MYKTKAEALAYLSERLKAYHEKYGNCFNIEKVERKSELQRMKTFAKQWGIPFRYEFYDDVFRNAFWYGSYGWHVEFMFADDWYSSGPC